MPTGCSICVHPQRMLIDAALVSGASLRDAARQAGVSKDAVSRHRPHVSETLSRKAERQSERQSETAARTLKSVLDIGYEKVLEILKRANKVGKRDAIVLQAVDRLCKLAEREFPVKAKDAPTDPRADWTTLSPAEKRDRLVEMKHRILELEAETSEGSH